MSAQTCTFYLFCMFIRITLSQPLINISNDTLINNTTTAPLTTTEFQTTFPYYTTPNYIGNDSTKISATLHFKCANGSIILNNMLISEMTQIFGSILNDTLVANGYANYESIIYLHPISNGNNRNITNSNLYLQWMLILLLDDNKDILISLLSEYLFSNEFKLQFNDQLERIMELELIETQNISIYNFENPSTTTINIETTIAKERSYVLPAHFRKYALIYVVLFCIVSIASCCFGGWYFTKKCVEKQSNDIDGDDNIGIVAGYNEQNGRYTAKKWEEVNQEDAEFMLKAFDDDEALHQNFYKDDSDCIEMTEGYYAGNYIETLSLSEKLKIHSAFDED